MPVNNRRIGWLGTLAIAGCVLLSSTGRVAGDAISSAGWWMTQPVPGQGPLTSVFGLADQAQVFGLTVTRPRVSGLTFVGRGRIYRC